MSKYYAVGNKVVLHGKQYKDGELLPERKKGFYSLLVGNGIAREEKPKKVFKSSAKEKAREAQAQPEEWGEKPVGVKTKIKARGEK